MRHLKHNKTKIKKFCINDVKSLLLKHSEPQFSDILNDL